MNTGFQTIILHVGLHKTGSTSIQNNSQFQHRELLLANGIQYASFQLEDKFRPNHGGPVTAALFANADTYGTDWRVKLRTDPAAAQQSFREQFDYILRHPEAETLLLSGEIFSLYNEPDIARLRDRLREHCRQLRVLVTLRNPLGFIESSLQQRIRAGKLPEPANLHGVTRQRYQRLDRVFGDALEVLNFDDCVASDLGLVGSFYERCGVPVEQLAGLEYGVANPRSSLEAFRIMRAINQRYPNARNGEFAALRKARDMQPLYAIPGARFSLQEFGDPAVYEQSQREMRWFEVHLGLVFRDRPTVATGETWSFATLAVLEQQLRELDEPLLREAATDFLEQEAERLAADHADTAAVLRFIVRRLREAEGPPPSKRLRELGPDYFRAGAQQVRKYSPELALKLMQVALELKPDARDIAQKVQEWQGSAPGGNPAAPDSQATDQSTPIKPPD